MRPPLLALAPALLLLLPSSSAAAPWEGPGSSYPVSELLVEYALDSPAHFPIREVLRLEVGLHPTQRGYVAPRFTQWSERLRLGSLPADARVYPSALQHINWWIVKSFNLRDVYGVIVTVPDIEPGTGRDLRPPGETRLRLRVWTGRVADVRTVADGTRFEDLPADRATNLASHDWMRDGSPVQAGGDKGLLRVAELDAYSTRLSRHPNRQVSAEISPGRQPGTARVNYRVIEGKPWTVYANVANTGTEATDKLRQRYGFTHTQLTGRDDILQLGYTTAGGFSDVHGVTASYEAPVSLGRPHLRYGLSGSWSQYDASELGFSRSTFEGTDWEAGARLVYNLLQRRKLFLDLEAGVRWRHAEVDNRFLQIDADGDFFVPHVGVRVERFTRDSSLQATAALEGNVASVAGSDTKDLRGLGRQDPASSFLLLRWDGSYSFYLEPWIARRFWQRYGLDPRDETTRAHELAFSFKGQWSEDRLVPQYEQTVGGFYTVRGYEQSLLAGDQVLIGSAEYRYHVPRTWSVDPRPLQVPLIGDVHLRPPDARRQPDWDLILRLFLDAAHVGYADAFDFEESETLASFGGGVELQVLRNLSLRVDTGMALRDVESESVRSGDTEVHFMGTFLY